MNIPALTTATLCGAALLSTPLFAQETERPGPPPGPPEGRNPGEMIKRADKDGDGKLSKEEFLQARGEEMEQAFGRMDANSDGFIDEAEITRMTERFRDGMAGRAGRGPEGMRRPEGDPGSRRPPGEAPGGPNPAMLEQAFQRMDQDGNGQLSKDEFVQGMAKMREFMGRSGEGPGRGPGPEGGARRPPQPTGEGQPPARPPLEGDQPAPGKPEAN